jgi:hypothetical protein
MFMYINIGGLQYTRNVDFTFIYHTLTINDDVYIEPVQKPRESFWEYQTLIIWPGSI